jgi:hypothetical protein
VSQTLLAVEAESLQTTVAEHLDDLGVLLAILLENEFTLLVVVLVLTTTTVLTTLLMKTIRICVKVICAVKDKELYRNEALLQTHQPRLPVVGLSQVMGGGVAHSNREGLNILRAYFSLILGHGGGVRRSLDLSLKVCRCLVCFCVKVRRRKMR